MRVTDERRREEEGEEVQRTQHEVARVRLCAKQLRTKEVDTKKIRSVSPQKKKEDKEQWCNWVPYKGTRCFLQILTGVRRCQSSFRFDDLSKSEVFFKLTATHHCSFACNKETYCNNLK